MITKHSPGPWALNPVNAQVDALPSQVPVCQLLWPTPDRSEAETEANGRLIAAAPKLLETIDWLAQTYHRAHHEGDPFTCEKNTCKAARDLIAEATGTKP